MQMKAKEDQVIAMIEVICSYYGVKFGQLMSKYRGDNVAQARHVAMYLAKEKTGLKYEPIAKLFKRDRTTVYYAWEKVKWMVDTKYDNEIKNDIFNINVLI